jgi:Strictosidine synthase
VEVLLDGLHFANGVTLTEDESALVFAETDGYRLSRLELRGAKSGERTILVDNMPGFPDNLSRSKGGRFWVAMVSPRNPFLDRLGRSPAWVRKALWRIPGHLQPKGLRTTWAMAFDERGRLVEDLQTARDDFHAVTGVAEVGGRLYLASLARSALLEVHLTA